MIWGEGGGGDCCYTPVFVAIFPLALTECDVMWVGVLLVYAEVNVINPLDNCPFSLPESLSIYMYLCLPTYMYIPSYLSAFCLSD